MPTMPPAAHFSNTFYHVLSQQSPSPLQCPSLRKTTSAASPSKRKDLKSKDKDEDGKPKRNLSSYNIFFQYERARLLSNGKVGFAALGRTIADKWNNLDEETRDYFDDLAAEDKARYRKELRHWKKAKMPNKSGKSAKVKQCNPKKPKKQQAKMNPQQESSEKGLESASFSQLQEQLKLQVPLSKQIEPISRVTKKVPSLQDNSRLRHIFGKQAQTQKIEPNDIICIHQETNLLNLFGTPSPRSTIPKPNISELASKLDDDCLDFLTGLL